MLGAFAGLGAVLLIFLLYIKNKTGLWWTPVRHMNCCEEVCPPISSRNTTTAAVPSSISHSTPRHKLGKYLKTYIKKIVLVIVLYFEIGEKLVQYFSVFRNLKGIVDIIST